MTTERATSNAGNAVPGVTETVGERSKDPTDTAAEAASAAEGKALIAARELAAAGDTVTARAVRHRAGVAMSVAADAARAWKAEAAVADTAPPVPAAVQGLLDALWPRVWMAAQAEFDTLRAGLEARASAAEDEVTALEGDVDEIETERDRLAQELASAADRLGLIAREHAEQLAVMRDRAVRAEATLEAVTAERDRLLAERGEAEHARDA